MSTAMAMTWNARNFGRSLPRPDPNSTNVNQIRQRILLETLHAFEEESGTRKFHEAAEANVKRWSKEVAKELKDQKQSSSENQHKSCKVVVSPDDWGVVTARLTREYGTTFAVLNMANAYRPGGGYTRGCAAQEENMFRRTDCHFSIPRNDSKSVRLTNPSKKFDSDVMYTNAMTGLLSAKEGNVYLDKTHPRVCIRGPEDREDALRLGYNFLPLDEIFPFYELRAAAVDLRWKKKETQVAPVFSESEMRRRISAQLDTLIEGGIRHAVLSAFGCGAFRNPANEVAEIYREEVQQRKTELDVVAFAVFHAGYGPNNFAHFEEAFRDFTMSVYNTIGGN